MDRYGCSASRRTDSRAHPERQRVAAAARPPAAAIWLPVAAFTLATLLAALAAVWYPAAAQDRPLSADFPEVYRVGGLRAPDWAQFSGPGPVAFDDAGRLYHLDNGASQVIVIGPGGELITTVGRKGEGPGEFNLPTGLVVWRDGHFVVPDMGHGAYQVFGPDGKLARYVRMSHREGIFAGIDGMRIELRPHPNGTSLLAQGTDSGVGDIFGGLMELIGEEETERTGVDDHGIERIDLSGDVAVMEAVLQGWKVPRQTEGEELSLNDLQNPRRLADRMGETLFGDMHLAPGFHWDVLPDGTIAYADSSTYEVKLAGAGGSAVIAVLRRPHAPEPVDGSIRARVIEYEMRQWEQADEELAGESGDEIVAEFLSAFGRANREQIEERPFFTEVSVVRGIRAAWDGALWIRRRGEEPWDNDGPIDVFGPDRSYVGTYDPAETGIPVAFGPDGLAAFWEFDELDVPSIVVKRLPVEVR